ncbi:23S rRNA (uracil-5-)-methyltransferase RumA, partial [Streptococcus agalactiae]|nr:23S rRNA (uracil-5-)-methyltransferase RumA [Streptococcus agalactiae]
SKNRVDPACSIYKECGGCQIMHLQYDKQLEFKTDVIRQALMKFKPEGYENYEIRKTIGMPEPEHYRAKLQFQVRSFGGNVKAGLYAQGTHRLIDIKDCLVQDSLTQEMINRVAELLG